MTLEDCIEEETKQRFSFQSFCLTLEDIKEMYSFFKENIDSFVEKKAAITNLTNK